MFGKDEKLEEIKEALAATGADMTVFRNWQKLYEKLNRQWHSAQTQYENARVSTEWVDTEVRRMEGMLTGEIPFDAKVFAQIVREMKRRQNSFDHEFLISSKDHEFHSTYDTIVRLGVKACEEPAQKLILQSEIENLLALLKEALTRERPSAWKLGFFMINHTINELTELPPAERLVCVERIYETEFVKPIITLVIDTIGIADEQRQLYEGATDRRGRRFLDATAILDNGDGEEDTLQQRAERIVGQMIENA